MNEIVSTLRAVVRQELDRLRLAELGVVTAIQPHSAGGDSDNYSCDVRLKNSGLALKRVPIGTDRIGTVAPPNVGDLVLLAFERGDVNQPLVIARFYNDEDRPPLSEADEVVFRLPLAAGDDESILAAIRNHASASPPRELIIEMPPKITVRITDGTVRATAGPSELFIDQSRGSGGQVTLVTGGTTITLDQDGDATVEAAGAMTLRAQRDLTLEGLNVSIKGQLKASVEAGTAAELTGLSTTVKGSAATTLQGATVQIKGVTSFSP